MKIFILSDHHRFHRGAHDFFPFYKWSGHFCERGMMVKFLYCHRDALAGEGEVLIISNRYFSATNLNRLEIVEFVKRVRKNYGKIVWFDAVDTSGSVDFDIIADVDIFLKKQVFKDRTLYLQNHRDRSVRIWLEEPVGDLKYANYVPCLPEQLTKVKVGWNIGLCDYRWFPGYTGVMRNVFFGDPKVEQVKKYRAIDVAYRGSIDYGNIEISRQRNVLLARLGEIKQRYKGLNIVLGDKVSHKQYLNELSNSKISVSPFGWGEICYRDFESILAGAILLKPSMQHIDTFPNIYQQGLYIEIDWALENFSSILFDSLSAYDTEKSIALEAQKHYSEYLTKPGLFIDHFTQCIS